MIADKTLSVTLTTKEVAEAVTRYLIEEKKMELPEKSQVSVHGVVRCGDGDDEAYQKFIFQSSKSS